MKLPRFSTIFTLLAIMSLGQSQIYGSIPRFDFRKVVSIDFVDCKQHEIHPDGNAIDQKASLQYAFGDANIIANAGVRAAANPNEPPFNYFFHPTDNETVVQSLQMVIDLTENVTSFGRAHLVMDCNNPQWCTLPNQWGYSQVWAATHKFWE